MRNKTNQTEHEKEAAWKANELILWMDNTEELMRLKTEWAKLYAKKMRKGNFDLVKAIIGMDNLRKQIQGNYNKHFRDNGETITITINEKDYILEEFTESVLYEILENFNDDIKDQAKKALKQLKGVA